MEIPTLREESRPSYLRQLIDENLNMKVMTLWQRLDCTRDKMRVKLIKVERHEGKLKFFPKERDGIFRFRSHLPVYLFSECKTIIFKTSIAFQSAMELELRFPSELRIQEFREDPRSKPAPGKELKVFFDLMAKDVKKSLIKRILNHSPKGFCFQVQAAEYPMYYEDDLIALKPECCEMEVPTKRGRIVHITRETDFHFFGKESFIVGVEFV